MYDQMISPDIRDYIDLDRYPIHDKGAERSRLVRRLQADLARDGCSVIKGFVRADRIADLITEGNRVAGHAHQSHCRTNAYFTRDRDDLPKSHPLNRFDDRSNAFVPADNFGAESILRGMYAYPPFTPFLQEALGEEVFYPYADPLADVIINVVEQGNGFPWHFDTNNYTVTLAIQNGQDGGAFEYCPWLRSATEENYEKVQAVLDGDRSPVHTLHLEPGDLQLFKGRYTLHRVTPVTGTRPRYVGIFSYAQQPDMVGSLERTRQLYGRVLPIHEQRAGHRADTLVD